MTRRRRNTYAAAAVASLVTLLFTLMAVPAGAAAITSFSPTCGQVGTNVTISGSGFSSGGNATAVRFGATAALFSVTSDSTIATVVPSGAATGTIAVDAPSGNTTSAASFQVLPNTAPSGLAVAPTSGAVGSTVTITGLHLCGTLSVRFSNGALSAATFTVVSDSTLTATVPTGATTGYITVQNQAGSSNTPVFTVTSAIPTITSFSPTSGPAGTAVTITGTNLTGATAVRFNGVSASIGTVSATQITTTVPTGATSGPISVTTPGGTATSAGTFTVTGTTHGRSVSFNYSGNKASGQVNVNDGFQACRSFVPVYIQQKKSGEWKLLDTTATKSNGSYDTFVPNKSGTFRAQVKKITLADGSVCGADASPTRQHN